MVQLVELFTKPLFLPNLSIFEAVWLLAGIFTNWRAYLAWQDARKDCRAAGLMSRRQQDYARSMMVALRWLLIAAIGLEAIGVAAALTPPPIVTTDRPLTPSTVLGAPLAIVVFMAITLALDGIVRARHRWRATYRTERR